MNVFQDFLKKNSSNAMLFNSYADAPTATMQRVKALMIGDLPQFIEISNNFNTEQVINTLKNYINEKFFLKTNKDNLIYQLYLNDQTVTHIGDIIWVRIFQEYYLNKTNVLGGIKLSEYEKEDKFV
jgi:phosphatidylinositol glycan class O